MPSPRAITPESKPSETGTSCTAAQILRRIRATSCTCFRSGSCAARSSPSVTSPRPRCATAPPRSGCEPHRSRTVRTCASSPRPGDAKRSSARAFHSERERVVDAAGAVLGEVPAIEMVTLGQRRGIGLPGGGPKRYVTAIDQATSTVVVGDETDLDVAEVTVSDLVWADEPYSGEVMVQCSAHGAAVPAQIRRLHRCVGTARNGAWRRARASCSSIPAISTSSAGASPGDAACHSEPLPAARKTAPGRLGATMKDCTCSALPLRRILGRRQQRRDHRTHRAPRPRSRPPVR